MATKKITELTELTTAASGDVLPIVDVDLDITKKITTANLLSTKQDLLESGTNIKTINSTSLLGSGDISIEANPSGGAGLIQFSDGSAFASDSNLFWDNTNKRLGIAEGSPTARVQIKGSGSTSATKALLVQNSSGTDLLTVVNDAINQAVRMPSAKIANIDFISGNVIGSANIRLVPTTGGIAINKDYSSASASTLLHIKGSGSTSATTSLLVQNSSGTDLMKVDDAGNINLRSNVFVNHPTVSSRLLRLGWGSIYAEDSSSELAIGADFSIPSSPSIRLAGSTRSTDANTMQLQAINGISVASSFTSPNSSAQLDIASTTKGFLPPRMTTTQKNAISSPANGLIVYDTTTDKLCCYNGTSWNDLF